MYRRQVVDAAVCDLLHDDWQRQLTHGRQRRAEQVENEDPQILFKVRRKTAYEALFSLICHSCFHNTHPFFRRRKTVFRTAKFPKNL